MSSEPKRGCRTLALWLTIFLAASCGGNPVGPADPVPLLPDTYVFSCAAWSPGVPPATRTIMDLTVWNGGAGSQPALEVIDVLKASATRIRYVFNTYRVRAEMTVSQVAVLH